jgi:hypothetical protein
VSVPSLLSKRGCESSPKCVEKTTSFYQIFARNQVFVQTEIYIESHVIFDPSEPAIWYAFRYFMLHIDTALWLLPLFASNNEQSQIATFSNGNDCQYCRSHIFFCYSYSYMIKKETVTSKRYT